MTKSDIETAIAHLTKVLDLNEKGAEYHAALADYHTSEVQAFIARDTEVMMRRAVVHTHTALTALRRCLETP